MPSLDYASFYETQVRPRREAQRFAARMVFVTLAIISPTLTLLLL
jgi:hypothetical protein